MTSGDFDSTGETDNGVSTSISGETAQPEVEAEIEASEAIDRRGNFKTVMLWDREGSGYFTSAEAARDMSGPWPVLDAIQGKTIRRKGGEPKNDACIAVIFAFGPESLAGAAKLAAADLVYLRLDGGPWFASGSQEMILSMAAIVLSYGFPTYRDPLMVRVGPAYQGGPVVASIPLHGPVA